MGDEQVTIDASLTIDGDGVLLSTATMHESISEVGGLLCELTTDSGAPDPQALLGKPAELTIRRQDGSSLRNYYGIVAEADRCADQDGRPMVRARIVPRLWRLSKRSNCRIFQEQTVVDIVKVVLSEGGVPEPDQQWELSGSYEPRVYVAQYRETDLHFILRLLSEEGIWWSVVHTEGVDRLVMCDDGTGAGDVEAPITVPFAHTTGFDSSRPQVMWLRRQQQVKTDKVSLRDYDFLRPRYQLDAQVQGTDEGEKNLEVYAYPGRFVDDALGEHHAQVCLESLQAERDVVGGETTLLTLKPGFRFTIEEHPYEPFNKEYLVIGVETRAKNVRAFHEGPDAGRDYVCDFRAVPTERTTYRAPRIAVSQGVAGVQTIFTTGPSGSEIHPDEHGQVKGRFLWDRTDPQDDTSSCWMRSTQLHTGDSMFLPRVNWEVTVRYLEGDVDRPMVMGRMYNALAPPPYSLPGGKARSSIQTATSPGGGSSNELRMDDTGGCEEMFVNASKDLTINVGNNMSLTIGNNETRQIGSNHSLSITNSIQANIGANSSLDVTGDQTMNVETFMVEQMDGNHELTIGGNRDMKVGGDHKRTVSGDSTREVDGMQTDLVVGSIEESCDGNWTHKVDAAMAEVTAGGRSFTVAGARTENVGAVKLVATKGGRGVEVGGDLSQKVAGAIVNMVKGDRADSSGGAFTDLVAGAQIVKAKNVTFEGESLVAVVMGASTLVVSSPAIMVAGLSVKLDGKLSDKAPLIVDN